jgi:ABC-2 type transport system ATP-binding protein
MTTSTTSSDDLAVRVRGLTKRYGDRAAVDGIDLDVRRGEVFALLGPNGAGKTTTVEVLEGYRRRDAGDVQVLGTDPDGADRAWRSRIGVVLQSNADHAELTVAELVRHFAAFYPRPHDPDEVIARVGLEGSRQVRTRALSGGQRRRLDVALGIVGNPELLFLDEPTTGFDPQARRQFWDLVSDLRDDGTTILLTTHYLDEAEHLADRVAVITQGSVAEVAPPAELGGRRRRGAVVTWTDADGRHEVTTTNPTAVVADLASRLAGPGRTPAEIPDLEVRRPTLEDVYLSLISAAAAAATSPPDRTAHELVGALR